MTGAVSHRENYRKQKLARIATRSVAHPVAAPDTSARITMRELGRHGQWGNQLFEYMFIRVAAKRLGINYEVPIWAGQRIFGHKDPPITSTFATVRETYSDAELVIFSPPVPFKQLDVLINRNFHGYGQFHMSWYAPDKAFIQQLFEAVPPIAPKMQQAMARLRQRGKTVIAFHIRRSDAGRLLFHLTPVTWYLQWLRDNWKRFEDPVLYIASEDPTVAEYFVHYAPVMMEDIGIVPKDKPADYFYPHGKQFTHVRQLDFFTDWYVLQHCDVMVASDSTFSFSAAVANTALKECWRSRLSTQQFELIDPWDSHTSWREMLDDYPGIPGTQLDSNETYAAHWKGYVPKYPSVPLDPEEIRRLMPKEEA